MAKQEHWEKRQEQIFPRGIEEVEKLYKWLAEKEYIDRGAYADGNTDGKIVLTTTGQEYLDRVAEREQVAGELINFGLLDANEYNKKGKFVFTDEGRKCIDLKQYRKGNIVFTKQGQKRLSEMRKQEALGTLYGVMDDMGEQLLQVAAFIAAGKKDAITHILR